ncbi:MAG: ComEC/Rec2 family competence protein [Candidatus Susulua stagnicola]|nr:ComEC/Rec2 family competence protein [Candidatus Susulua stagnicola]
MKTKSFSHLLPFCIFIAFSIGVVFGKFILLFWAFFISCVLFSILIIFFYKKQKLLFSDIFILFFLLSLGALWHLSSSSQISNKFLKKESIITLKVISLPKEGANKNTFTAEVKKINSHSLKLKVKVSDYTQIMDYLRYYQFVGKIAKRKYRDYSYYSLNIKKDVDVKELPLGIWTQFTIKSSKYILNTFKENCSSQGYRFLSGVFLGRKELLGKEKKVFSNAGVSHLLAISGLHLGFTSLVLFFILRLFNIKFRVSLIGSLVFLCFYTFLTGASSSTLRAVTMYSIFVFSFFFQRKANLLNSLALAGFIALFLDSSSLFAIGFQLSFISVFAMIISFKIFNIKSMKIAWLNYLKQMFFCSFFVTLFLTPVVSYYFGKIYILSIFYNLILIPFFTFILAVNFLLLIFSPFKFIAQSFGEVLSLLISGFINLVQSLGSIKFSFIFYDFSFKAIIIYYLILGVVLTYFFFKNKSIRPKA